MRSRKLALAALLLVLAISPAQAQQATSLQFEDWVFACDPATRQCMMQQILLSQGRPVMTVMIGFNAHHQTDPLIAMNVPRGLRAGDLVTIQVEDKELRGIPVLACNPQMCTAIAKLDEAAAAEFKTGSVARVTIPSAGPRLAFDVSLAGFSAAYAAMLAKKAS